MYPMVSAFIPDFLIDSAKIFACDSPDTLLNMIPAIFTYFKSH